MKKTTTYALFVVAGTACVIVDWRFNFSAWMGLFGIVVGLYGLHRLLIAWESSQNLRAIRSAFANLDLIYAGLHFVGAESELIDWRRVDHPRDDGPIQIAQLGRTKK